MKPAPFSRVAGFDIAPTHDTREGWMQAAVDLARPMFIAAGKPLPLNTRVSVGFTAGGARSQKHIGECWGPAASIDGGREIFIRPELDKPLQVLSVLVHELCHAALPHTVKHTAPFRRLGEEMLLEGKPKSMHGGVAFAKVWEPLLDKLGPYPHARFNAGKREKQTTRMIKVECNSCGFSFRTSRKWIADGGELQCPSAACGGEVKVEE